jgi:tetratricopeptide (TPR) repeat protein
MQMTRQSLHDRQMALIEHYLERLDTLSQMHRQGGSWAQEALRSFDLDWQQFQAQQRWAVSMAIRDQRAAELAASFPDHARTLLRQIDTRDAIKWLDDARMWASVDDLNLNYRLLLLSCQIRLRGMETERAREHLEDLGVLADRLGDDHLRLEAVALKVEYYNDIGDKPRHLEWAEHALMLAQRLEDQEALAEAYRALGFACVRSAQPERADTYLRTALDLFQQLGLRLKVGDVYNSLAANCFYWGKYADALPYVEQALAIMREFGERQRERNILANMGMYATAAGDLERALRYSQQALAAATEHGLRRVEYTALLILMMTTAYLGLAEDLGIYIKRARLIIDEKTLESLDEDLAEAINWCSWHIAHEQEDWDGAQRHAERGIQTAGKYNDVSGECMAAGSLGNTLCEQGDFEAATDAYTRSLAFSAETYKNPQLRAPLAGLSYAQAQRGYLEEAQGLFDTFYALLTKESLVKLDPPFMTAWNAYRAAQRLGDPRIEQVLQAFKDLFDTYLSHLHDKRLRTSFLSQYSVRSLIAAHSAHFSSQT